MGKMLSKNDLLGTKETPTLYTRFVIMLHAVVSVQFSIVNPRSVPTDSTRKLYMYTNS